MLYEVITLTLTEDTGPERMAAFAFADGRPTFAWLTYEWGLARLGVHSAKPRALPAGVLRKYGLYLVITSYSIHYTKLYDAAMESTE